MIEWRCLVLAGNNTRDWRVVLAPDEAQAAAQLIDEGVLPLEIRTGAPGIMELLNRPVALGGGLSIGDQALILSQLAMLLKAGMPIDRSIDLLREQMPKASQQHYLAEVLSRIRNGEGLAPALDCRPVLAPFVTGLIAAAEQTGQLEPALSMLAQRVAELAAARRDLITALAYPAAVLAATLIALFVVVGIVIPQFEPVFAGEEHRLPLVTQGVLAFARITRESTGSILAGMLLVALALYGWSRTASARSFFERNERRLPVLALRSDFLGARFATILGMLLENGMPIVRALTLTGSAFRATRWRTYCDEIETRIRAGESMSGALARNPMLTPAAVRLIETGERSGRLGRAFTHAGQIMQANAKARLDRIIALANPVAIILLGSVVALLIGGVMLGIFALGDFTG